jgi:hypothetical protein
MSQHCPLQLETLMAKMILIGEVAHLAKDIEARNSMYPGALLHDSEKVVQFRNMVDMADSVTSTDQSPVQGGHKTLQSSMGSKVPMDNLSPNEESAASETENIAMQQSMTANVKLLNLLDEW